MDCTNPHEYSRPHGATVASSDDDAATLDTLDVIFAEEVATRPTRVLLVDDDAMVRRVLVRTLSTNDRFVVDSAVSADDGIERVRECDYDIVISDLRMPGEDGISFLTRVRALRPDIERILLTGYAELDAAVRAINDAQVTRLLNKPISRVELFRVLSDVRGTQQLRAQTRILEHGVRRRNHELELLNGRLDALLERRTGALIDGLLAALEYRDSETQWHSRRVALYTRAIGSTLGVERDALARFELGALLHDVGKIGIADAIMLKPGKLTEDEWEVMRTHPQLGYELLGSIEFLHEARQLVLEHHERWDGRGYPQGLAGEAISLGARIFAVADTLDAMTSDRPYRKALPVSVAWDEIVAHAGGQFDPQVVEAFCSIGHQAWEAAVALGQSQERGTTLDEETIERIESSVFGQALATAGAAVASLVETVREPHAERLAAGC